MRNNEEIVNDNNNNNEININNNNINNKKYDEENENYKKNEKDDTNNTITYFMECLATCHSITKINDENKGNSIDIKIFTDVNWIYDFNKCKL